MNKTRTIGIALFTFALVALSVCTADAQTTRFPNGITNVQQEKLFGYSVLPDKTKVYEYFNDFITTLDNVYGATIITTATSGISEIDYVTNWAVSRVSTGSPTQVILNVAGGILCVTNGTADNDVHSCQLTSETFMPTAGKKLWFKSRVKLPSKVTQSDFYIGLMVADSSIVASSPADWITFKKDDGDAYLDFSVKKDADPTEDTEITTLVLSTWYTLGFYYDGVDRVNYFVDDEFMGSCVTDNLPDDEALCVTFLIQNGEAAASDLEMDYIYVVQER